MRALLTSRRRLLHYGLSLTGLSLLPGRVLAAPLHRALPRVGFIKQPPLLDYVDAFLGGMRDLGHVDGESYILDYRYVEQPKDLPAVAAELAQLPVDILVCPNTSAVDAALRASSTIPIVFATPANPVASGYVESLSRPGGRLTGPSQLAPGVTGKRLQLLSEIAPGISRVGVFWNPDVPSSASQWQETQEAAETLGLGLLSLEAREPADFKDAFGLAVSGGADALFMPITQVIMVQLPLVAKFAMDQRLPAMSFQREFPDAGGLVSYGASIPALYRRAAYYVDRILRGADPSTLPVEQPTAFDLIVNLKAAQAIGLTIPQSVLLQASELLQ
jgi:putative ABC transport system substrate-binding protein